MATKPKLFVVPIPVYEHKVICIVTKNPQAVDEAFSRMKLNYCVGKNQRKILEGRGGLCWYGCDNTIVIWMAAIPRTPYQISVLIHEITHAAIQMLSSVGVPVDAKTDEAVCYLLDYLTQTFLEKMWKNGRGRSKASKQ